MSLWVLVVVLWQAGADPSVMAYPQTSSTECSANAASFVIAEINVNDQMPPEDADRYSISCELKSDDRRATL